MQECKDAEPDVLFVGDSMVQLMQQYEVIVTSLISQSMKGEPCVDLHFIIMTSSLEYLVLIVVAWHSLVRYF